MRIFRRVISKVRRSFCRKLSTHAVSEDLRRVEVAGKLLRDWYIGYATAVPSYAIIAFSRDRPMQLHAMLSSYLTAARTSSDVTVLFYGSTHEFQVGYQKCFECFEGIRQFTFVHQKEEGSFRTDLLQILESIHQSRIAFLVDDIVFIRDFDLHDFDRFDLRLKVPSLRMGRTIRYSYTMNKPMKLPSISDDGGFLSWQWRGNDIDWAYPLSVDGNVFLRNEIVCMLSRLDFRSPNTLEAEMQTFIELYLDRSGICYDLPRLINLPINRVQEDFPNRSGVLSPNNLLFKWMDGLSIDFKKMRELVSNSVHSELSISYIRRETQVTDKTGK